MVKQPFKKKITTQQLIIVILVVIIAALLFFGYLYFNQVNPMEVLPTFNFSNTFTPDFLFSINIAENGGLSNPMAVAVKGKKIYIADTSNHRIAITDRNGKLLGGFGGYGSGNGKLNYPVSVAAVGGLIYVADLQNNRITVFDDEGKFRHNWPDEDTHELKGIRPLAIVSHSDGRLFVSDANQQRILVLNQKGKVLNSFGSPGIKPGQLSFVNGLAINEEDEIIYISDSNNRRLQVWGLDGKFKSVISGDFATPRGIAYDEHNGLLYVVDTLSSKVVILDPNNPKSERSYFNQAGDSVLQFPHGIAIDQGGRIYVSEKQGNRVNVYQ